MFHEVSNRCTVGTHPHHIRPKFENLQSQGAEMAISLPADFHSHNMQAFLDSLNENSRPVHQKWITKFEECLNDCQTKENSQSLETSIPNFFESLYDKSYATSTLWNAYSVVKTFLQITQTYRLHDKMPQLSRMLSQKKEETKKSHQSTTCL